MLQNIPLKLAFIFFLGFFSLCSAQRIYDFDHKIEYLRTNYRKGSKPIKITYYTNSRDNSYSMSLSSEDSLTYYVKFSHYDNIYSNFLISKQLFDNSEICNLSCDAVKSNKNLYKWKADEYDFFILKDTVLNQKLYSVYEIKSILKDRKSRKNKAGSELYIIDKSTSSHLPLFSHPTVYEKWKRTQKIRYGIYKEKHSIDFQGKTIIVDKLISVEKIDKKITVPPNCI